MCFYNDCFATDYKENNDGFRYYTALNKCSQKHLLVCRHYDSLRLLPESIASMLFSQIHHQKVQIKLLIYEFFKCGRNKKFTPEAKIETITTGFHNINK